jgi:hypothetical protein
MLHLLAGRIDGRHDRLRRTSSRGRVDDSGRDGSGDEGVGGGRKGFGRAGLDRGTLARLALLCEG